MSFLLDIIAVIYFLFLVELHHTEILRLLLGTRRHLADSLAILRWHRMLEESLQIFLEKNANPDAINDQSRMDAIGGGTYMGKVTCTSNLLPLRSCTIASSSTAKWNWSTYTFIHSVKRNQLDSKKAEDLVHIHNWRLLSCKDPRYIKGPAKLWDVLPETPNLDMTVQDLARIALLNVEEDAEEEDMTASTASGTGFSLGSTDEDVDIVGDEAIDPSFFDDPFDP